MAASGHSFLPVNPILLGTQVRIVVQTAENAEGATFLAQQLSYPFRN